MTSLWPLIEPLLPRVSKPARYIGGEMGACSPVHDGTRVAWLLAYPDTYEIGLPNQGLQILYEILNDRDDALAERTYAPWIDMEEEMRRSGVPLFSVENHLPAASFDVVAFNLSAELVYTNVLNLLDLGGIPLRSSERVSADPIVMAGGHCTYNPEPLAEFIDAFVIGDGEEVVGEINSVLSSWRSASVEKQQRQSLLHSLSCIEGVYVPSLYRSRYDGRHLVETVPQGDVPAEVTKRTVADLAEWPLPRRQLVPLTEVVHDRLNVEVFRGCTRGCRFCQAGMITRPVRERPARQVSQMVRDGLDRTGYDEVALTSLSTADFSGIEGTVQEIVDDPVNGGRVSVSLPSLRVDAFTVATAAQIQKVRRTGLTFAPEGGTWRMRQVINKLIREEDLYSAVDAAFGQGWRRVKLYFLIGLPTERDEDVLGIADLGRRCVEIGARYHRSVTVVASVGGFVPKPHTPFQWFAQNTADELRRKVALLRSASRDIRGLTIRWHDPDASTIEGIASRGDRRIGAVIERVWRAGGTFQEWSECFNLELWLEAMAAEGLSLDDFVHRERAEDEVLPWGHISAGLHEDFLWDDWQQALQGGEVEDCRWTPCYDCGACTDHGIEHVVASAVPPAGGSQGTGQDLTFAARVPVRFSAAPDRQPSSAR
ncbi:MAG: TIGR03960 family B12-binding radical SAM protein [Acidimicrobiales bacterium]